VTCSAVFFFFYLLLQRPSKDQRTIREPKTHRDYAELRHGPEFVENLRRDSNLPSGGTVMRQSVAGSEIRSHMHPDIQRSGSLKSPTGVAGRSVEVSRTPSSVSHRAATLHKTDSLPPSLTPYQTARDVHADYQSSSGSIDYRMAPGYYQQELSPAEMALRGMSARQMNAGPYAQRASVSQSPSMGIRPTMPPPAPPSATPTPTVLDTSRSSLPPPPPTPQDMSTPVSGRAAQAAGQFVPPKNSPDLPPPPAWQHGLPGADGLQSPVMSPSATGDNSMSLPSPPPFLPPPPLSFGLPATGDVSDPPCWGDAAGPFGGGSVLSSAVSDANSDTSSTLARPDDVGGGVGKGKGDSQPMVRDTRSDLLSAIREGKVFLVNHL
jgi:hypothetical protein